MKKITVKIKGQKGIVEIIEPEAILLGNILQINFTPQELSALESLIGFALQDAHYCKHTEEAK